MQLFSAIREVAENIRTLTLSSTTQNTVNVSGGGATLWQGPVPELTTVYIANGLEYAAGTIIVKRSTDGLFASSNFSIRDNNSPWSTNGVGVGIGLTGDMYVIGGSSHDFEVTVSFTSYPLMAGGIVGPVGATGQPGQDGQDGQGFDNTATDIRWDGGQLSVGHDNPVVGSVLDVGGDIVVSDGAGGAEASLTETGIWAKNAVIGGQNTGQRYTLTYSSNGDVTGWQTIATITPSTTASRALTAIVTAWVAGATRGLGNGAMKSEWTFSVASGSITVTQFGSDFQMDSPAPQFRLQVSGSSVLAQIQSSNGSAIFDGTAIVEMVLPVARYGINYTIS